MAAAPASAAACSGTTGVTVVVDTGSSISTKCASGDPSSALKALTSAGFSVTYPQQYPGSVVCRINGYPASDPCVRMPPGDAYWAFFHAKRGGSWAYSSSGVASVQPRPGHRRRLPVRLGAAAPASLPRPPTKTSTPTPTKTTTKPKPTTAHADPEADDTQGDDAQGHLGVDPVGAGPAARPRRPPRRARHRHTVRHALGERHGIRLGEPDRERDGHVGGDPERDGIRPRGRADIRGRRRRRRPGHALAGAALVALVAGGAGWAAWKRRT